MAERRSGGNRPPGTPSWGVGPNGGPPVGNQGPLTMNPPLMGQPLPPVEALPGPPKGTNLFQEYVAGAGMSWYGPLVRALPPAIDQLTSDFGDDLYDRMLVDPQIAACITILRAAILEDGLHLSPAIQDEDDERYQLAVEIHEEAEQMVDDLTDALPDSLWDMLGCVAKGNRVAEIKWVDADARKDGRPLYNVGSLKVKPRRATAFVVDPYLNLVGLLGRPPGFPSPFLASWLLDPKSPPPNLVPRSRFAVLTFRPEDGDPRGTSLLRPAYDPWWRKRQIYVEYLRYLTQFAGPSLWGTVPEKAQPQPMLDADGIPIPGAPLMTPEQALFNAMQLLRSGTAGAFPFGTTINAVPVQNSAGSDPFLRAIAEANIAIVKTMLTQQLATEEGEHMSRSAAEVHQDVLDTIVRQGKQFVVRMLVKDVFAQWVVYNWGPKARRLVPHCSLGVTEEHDRSQLISAVASLASATLTQADGTQIGYLAPSQLQDLDDMIGIPVRSADEVPPSPQELRQQQEERAQQQQQALADAAKAQQQQNPQPAADSGPGGPTPPGDAGGRGGPGRTGAPAAPAPPPGTPAPNGTAKHARFSVRKTVEHDAEGRIVAVVEEHGSQAERVTVRKTVQHDADGRVVGIVEEHVAAV